ncbi:DUF3016 domain-containing protein [Shewanella fidelis]|uniref:DUF3016 domain-containing protein n=1 Tax=Shewanella fidelis TaxID=173509 RepID=A0AAW8NHN2_9GAMM|nr:DUF3016 domain-containing protein [Shewanella fidelis]MDR8522192.1 DUF3016 domain-containing protein [Shewanella fidelis]MDW4812593.1 DUF3016 domain-containing protein [Shewanella fidelis]MDW4816341.1 DUF3016 domain-containing protein [Shewanella fidelis]MDW4820834.1 DUF3016 domain-containing protein [Shewanella fidelis]MDW4825057.1 DUF3016 domain-containing protein [Shewanella fidelis]
MKAKYMLVASLLVSSSVWAADDTAENPVTEQGVVKVEWQDPSNFRDIRSSSEIQSRFEKRTFEQLTKNLDKEASKILKPEQKLEMVVTDLDLAGDVRPTFGATVNDLRVVKDIYPPRITFSYKILEGDKVIMAGNEKLTDMGFMYSINKMNDKPYRYENALLTGWLKDTIKPKL